MHFPSPRNLKEQRPLSQQASSFISQSRATIKKIFTEEDPRLLMVVGPCSIHRVDEALEYARALKELAEEVKDSCFLVMRAYIEKPRTREGWKGLAHDPYLNGSEDIEGGLVLSRSLLVALAELGVPAATEILTPHLVPYIEDLISWGCIGARTSSSQIHRLLASYLHMPVGFKNTIDGNIGCAIDGVHVAKSPHKFLHFSEHGQLQAVHSQGNPYTHLVLRGSSSDTNFEKGPVQEALSTLQREGLPPRVLIDCSHGNSKGQHFRQKEVFQKVMEQIREGNTGIMGMMLESNLEEGRQKIPSQLSELQKGVSITDGCLDFSTAVGLISSISMSLTHS